MRSKEAAIDRSTLSNTIDPIPSIQPTTALVRSAHCHTPPFHCATVCGDLRPPDG
jgi:hypothetical protein